jgi:DNA primase
VRPEGHGYDPERLRRDHPIAEVVAAAGVELRPSGRALVGRCPLHDDRGRPNLYVRPDTASYYCFRCGFGGDVIDFVMRREGVAFRDACARLSDQQVRRPADGPVNWSTETTGTDDVPGVSAPVGPKRGWDRLGLDEQQVMNCALAVYRRALWANRPALDYVRRRGVPDWVLRECGVGYADGHSLESLLRRRSLLRVAEGIGLFRRLPRRGRPGAGGAGDRSGPGEGERGGDSGDTPLSEALAGRIVVPELRGGHAIWFIGRCLEERPGRPKYLALAGERPVLGYERASGQREVFLCEGVFDYLTAVGWRLPAFSPCGTSLPIDRLGFLARTRTVYGALDGDPAGRVAAGRFAAQLGRRFVPLRLPAGRDLNDLGQRPDGRATFYALLERARRVERERSAGASGAGGRRGGAR